MSIQEDLLAEIEAFLVSRDMPQTTFGRLAMNDGKFVTRVRSGGNMTLSTVERVRRFMRSAPAQGQAA